MSEANTSDAGPKIVIVTGPSGAGRSTTINALEDMGFESIDNLPLSLFDRLMDGPPLERPLAIGVDTRTRDFSAEGLIALCERATADPDMEVSLLYLDADTDVLLRRFSETRRKHPLAPAEAPLVGIERERDLLGDLRARADILIDTSNLTPHQLKTELGRWFESDALAEFSVTIQSFSYKRGLPRGADMLFDVRFLRNPYWDPNLRGKDGRDADVQDYVTADPLYAPFFEKLTGLAELLLPAYRDEGKAYFTIAIGCTGGQHRSVTVAEALWKRLQRDGWPVVIRHREMERVLRV
ncbi:RNase adapter RapZ [Paracoccaceae bacterium GXU_MW_L88]